MSASVLSRFIAQRRCSSLVHQLPKLYGPLHPNFPIRGSRHFSWNPVPVVGEQILEVGNAISQLPLADFIGPYAAGIIVSTVAVRTAVTLPVFFWARKRVARHRDIVIPKIIEWRKPFAKELAAKAKSQPNPKEWFDAEFKKAAIAYRSGLLKQYKCQPFWTAIAPPLTLIPTLILTSLSIRSICVLPNSPFLFERFLSDVPLAFPDATGVFPIAVGLLGLTSLELGKKFARERAGELKEKEWVKRHVEKHPVDQGLKKGAVQMLVQTDKGWQVQTTQAPKTARRPAQKDSVVENISKTPTVSDPMMSRLSTVAEQVGRAGTILMIGISMWSPGAITLCWVTSSCFSIMQTLLGQWYDKRHPVKTG